MTIIIMFGCLNGQLEINKQLTFRSEQCFLHSLEILIAHGLQIKILKYELKYNRTKLGHENLNVYNLFEVIYIEIIMPQI